jgi:hypothetical protein
MTVDHNPDDPSLISRQFADPFLRLEDIKNRLSKVNGNGKYFDITLGIGSAEKYHYELYYDMLFMKAILAKLGVIDKVPVSVSNLVLDESIDKVIDVIVSKVKSGEVGNERRPGPADSEKRPTEA